MCVRTLVGEETQTTVSVTGEIRLDEGGGGHGGKHLQLHPHQLQHQQKLMKAKDRYIKIHDELVEKDRRLLLLPVTPEPEEEEEEEDQHHHHHHHQRVPEVAEDLLAASTVLYSKWLNCLGKVYEAWQQSCLYKILFHTTQPAHVITIAAVLCVTSALVPSSERVQIAGHPHSGTASFIYLASFVMHIGAQIWMTFVSGLSLYFALPRHTFGEVQRVLFPRYFTINACLSLTTLLIFVKHHPAHTWDAEVATQVGCMSSAFFLELLIRLYLTPPLLRLIVQKNTLERAAGVGSEIGKHSPGPLKHCPHYARIHSAFRRVHMSIAMGNMLTMACTVLHLHYIASKLCFL